LFRNISQDEFQKFHGVKIERSIAKNFFDTKAQEFQILKTKLGFRSSKQ